ncbi:MAG: sodium-translocating pyrophosphatase [Promethearchaeota archaeon]|nr:MAG: sodium-translocating pyrophosphatase [Candidatus Lokiarchaeota archaeon]
MLLELPIVKELGNVLANIGDYPKFLFCLYVLIPLSLIIAFIFLMFIFFKIHLLEEKNGRMRESASHVHDGAKVYLRKQAKVLMLVLIILFIPVGLTGLEFLENNFLAFIVTAVIFMVGSISSLIAGYIGMMAATKSNILVVEAAADDPQQGFKLAYSGGMITGILNISMFVLGIWLILLLTNGNVFLMISYDFGASVSALLSQVGGGIYTKSADIGADIAGKYEMGICEDDPRNPAVIADLVGDNVGDCAGRGADLFESASSDAVGGMILGLTIFLLIGDPIFIISDLTLISLGLLSLFFTIPFLKVDLDRPSKSIWRVFVAATAFNVVILLILNFFLFGSVGLLLFLASLMGLITSFIGILFSTYYTSMDYAPTKRVAESSKDGPSLTIISGLSTGFSAVFFPILLFCISIIITFFLGYNVGLIYFNDILTTPATNILGQEINPSLFLIAFGVWGVNMASVSSDIIISTILSFDTFGPIMDNAAGIVEMGGKEDNAPEGLRPNLDKLDALGNTTKAVAKGFALICGGFSSIVMLLTFLQETTVIANDLPSPIPTVQLVNIFDYLDFYNPLIILGIFIGVMIPVLFSSMILRAVQGGANKVVKEVRFQFETIEGLKDGTCDPDYNACIKISAQTALRKMLKPVLIIIFLTILTGILLGPMVIAGLLIGNLIGCLIFGLFMSISGASFDNAKKGIEDGLYGGKNSDAHKASIIGDTVGDPLKDTAGPSMNILITTINTLALTFLPLFIMTAFLWPYLSF